MKTIHQFRGFYSSHAPAWEFISQRSSVARRKASLAAFPRGAWERYNQARGFSLIELSVVLLIMTLMATVAIRSTNDLTFQVRYEQTQERLQQLKAAILGNPKQIINGQLAVSGFVADMGRLPTDIHELLEREFCSNRLYTTQADCLAALATWHSMPPYATGVCSVVGNYDQTSCIAATGTWTVNAGNLGMGWRGGYLSVSGNANSDDALPDGWGNVTTTKTNHNYGWQLLSDTPLTGDLTINSYGKNQAAGGTDYDEDDAVILSANDWRVALPANINVTINPLARKVAGVTRPTDQITCEFNGGTWATTCAMPIEYDQTQCTLANGSWATTCSIVNPASSTACLNAGGTWNGSLCSGAWSSYRAITLCLNFYYRDTTPSIMSITSTATITENGLPQVVNFSLGTAGNFISFGKAAIRMTETTSGVCNNVSYPVTGVLAQPVTILANQALDFTW